MIPLFNIYILSFVIQLLGFCPLMFPVLLLVSYCAVSLVSMFICLCFPNLVPLYPRSFCAVILSLSVRLSCFLFCQSLILCALSSVLLPLSHQSDYVHLCSPGVSSLLWLPLVRKLSASPPVRCHDLPDPWMSALSDCICAVMSTSSLFIKYLPVGVIKRFKLCCWPCATGSF